MGCEDWKELPIAGVVKKLLEDETLSGLFDKWSDKIN